MKYLSIDQSLSSCALVVFDDENVVYKEVVRTGSTSSKGKQKSNTLYFEKEVQQMAHICQRISTVVQQFKVEHVIMESLSFGSVGSATRSLGGLFYCINYMLLLDMFPLNNIHTVAPTAVKSFAREFLPLEEQTSENDKKKVVKVKMMKTHMIKVANTLLGEEFLEGYKQSTGAGDLADAALIGLKWYRQKEKKS